MSKDFLDSTIKEVKNINMYDILKDYMDLSKKQGNHYLGLCPFHKDTKLGNLKVTPNKNYFKCFACGAGGDAIGFVAEIKNITYDEAAVNIAYEYGIISIEEKIAFEKRKGKNLTNKFIKNNIPTKGRKINPKRDTIKSEGPLKKEELLCDDEADIIFNAILDALELKEEHKSHLIKKRKLSEETIKKRKYKSTDSVNDAFIKKVIINLEKDDRIDNGKIEELLKKTPGFYKERINGKWEWMYKKAYGIYIPIRNFRKQIVGLQIRADKKSRRQNRYYWLSSASVNSHEGFKYGTGQKSRLDILYPDTIKSNSIFITEGRFKSEAIVNIIGAVCISVQGVLSWKNIDEVLKNIESELNYGIIGFNKFENICVAYDMDKEYKPKVFNALKEMTNHLYEKFKDKEIYYVEWSRQYKGIDDLLNSISIIRGDEYYEHLEVEMKILWDKEHEVQIIELLNSKGVYDISELEEDDIKENIDVSQAFKKRRNYRA